MELAQTAADFEAIGVTSDFFVRNREAWFKYRKTKSGILQDLTEAALGEFEDTMSFGRISGCLLSAKVEKIATELGDRFPEFFRVFGMDRILVTASYPYICAGKKCKRKAGWYCFQPKGENCNNGD